MTYQISLKLKPETHQRFAHIHQQLNAGESQSLAKPLGEVLADISCEVIDQVFGDLARLSTSAMGSLRKLFSTLWTLCVSTCRGPCLFFQMTV